MHITVGWECPTVGTACNIICSNGKQDIHQAGVEGSQLSYTEYCDDGNTSAGDGCSSTCGIESGWECFWPGDADDPFVDQRVSGIDLTRSFW
jgi:cysteine-rich repeat protein